MTAYNNETNTHSVVVIDPSTNTVIKNIPIGETDDFFGDLIYNPSNEYVYVTSIMNEIWAFVLNNRLFHQQT